jgi:RNA polymerase sigma-70 factor (ECF subfamily)
MNDFEEIIRQFQCGEITQDLFYSRFEAELGSKVKGFIYSLTGDQSQADDVYQDFLMLLLKNISLYKIGTNFQAWTIRMVRNVTFKSLEKKKRHSGRFSNIPEDTRYKGPGPKTDNIKKEQQEILMQAINGLEPKFRELLYLRFFCEMSLKEIAAVTGLPISTLDRNIQKGLGIIDNVIRSLSGE